MSTPNRVVDLAWPGRSAHPRLAAARLPVAVAPATGVGALLALCVVARDGLADRYGDPLRSVRQHCARRPRPGAQGAKADQFREVADRRQRTATAGTQVAEMIGGVALASPPGPAGQARRVRHADHCSFEAIASGVAA